MKSGNNDYAEYVYDDEEEVIECEYVYEEESREKTKESIKGLAQENNKPKHKVNESGVYDELDYDLYPRNKNHSRRNHFAHDECVNKDWKIQKRYLKKKQIIITMALLTVCVIGIVIAIVILVPAKSEACTDQLPENWKPNEIYQPGVICSGIDCESLAHSNSCSLTFSEVPLSNCIDRENGTVMDFCRFSCNNCVIKQRVEASTTHMTPESAKDDLQCPSLSAFEQQNRIVALFGGFDQSGFRLNTIETLPKVSCSLLPRAIDDEIFAQKGLKSEQIITSLSHILPPGILISCLSTRTKFLCFKKNLKESLNSWQEITLTVPGKGGLIANFQGVVVGSNLILRLNNKRTITYNQDEKIIHVVKTNPEFYLVQGACYISINSTHFVQIGGELNGNILNRAYMISLAITERSYSYSAKYHLTLEALSDLHTKRKYAGCTTGVINGENSIIVAGGTSHKESFLNSVEYLPLPFSSENEIIRSEKPVKSDDIGHFLPPSNLKEDTHQWKALPSFQIARSGFPTIFSSETKLFIVGGKCPSNIKHHCNKEEVLSSENCSWIITNDTIKSIRYNHNSEDVTKICH